MIATKLLVLTLAFFFSSIETSVYGPWGYEESSDVTKELDPADWYLSYPQCAGLEQSPIDIQDKRTVYDPQLLKITIDYENKLSNNDDFKQMKWLRINNGHTVLLSLQNGEIGTVFEHEQFKLAQMHFHWGHSEHLINGKMYAAELHLVHTSYLNPSKYAVLGFMLQLSEHDNPALDPLIRQLGKTNATGNYLNFNIKRLIRTMEVSNYYRYMGSLTTPPCSESINWFLVDDPFLTVSQAQLDKFDNLKDHDNQPVELNARSVQNLNTRVVRRSWNTELRNKL